MRAYTLQSWYGVIFASQQHVDIQRPWQRWKQER